MKTIITTLLFSISLLAAKADLGEFIPDYIIKSDEKDLTIKKGFTRVFGKVTKYGKPVAGVRISTLNHEKFSITKTNGSYSFLIKDTDSSLYAYKSRNSEVIINYYDFKSRHKVEIDFYLQESMLIEMDKPVIYLYPEKEEKITVKLNIKGELTFTYPVYKDSWKITASPDGTLSDGKRTYPYLFWEGKQDGLSFTKNNNGTVDGFFIKTDSSVKFLEEKLTTLGLNSTESTDFITFWSPRMEQKEYAYIQFFIDEEYNSKIATLDITPIPNSIKRIYMVYSGVDKEDETILIVPQELTTFKRKGFTIIEWGGSEIPFNEAAL